MNTVPIDDAALAAEADAAVSDLPPDSSSPSDVDGPAGEGQQTSPAAADLSMEQIEQIARGYEPGAFMLIRKGFDFVAPAWGVTTDECKGLSQATALALAAWFPEQQLPPKYLALFMVVGSLFSIVEARRDPDTGEIKPRKLNAEPAQPAAARTAGGGFSTVAN